MRVQSLELRSAQRILRFCSGPERSLRVTVVPLRLSNNEDPFEIFRALMEQAGERDSGLTRGEAYEIMEGMIPERLRSI